MRIDYSSVTEVPGHRVTNEQLARMYHRYRFACEFCNGKDVLEVACGAGQGLGYLAKYARRIVGGDYTEGLVRCAKRYYKDRVELHILDAHQLPYKDESFDVVILYEAFYYLAKPETFVGEARRVLRKPGTLLIASVNKDWPEFNPSPFCSNYYSVPELSKLLENSGFTPECYGAFSSIPKTAKDKIVSNIRRMAVALHLIPKTMKGKEFLKKLFYGRLVPLREEIQEGMYEYQAPEPIPLNMPNYEYKVFYCAACL